jgi:hypothetical protein
MSEYADRDIMALDKDGGHYCRHVMAMTREDLHGKSDIAAELAWRDWRIAQLEASPGAATREGTVAVVVMKALEDAKRTLDRVALSIGTSTTSENELTWRTAARMAIDGIEWEVNRAGRTTPPAPTTEPTAKPRCVESLSKALHRIKYEAKSLADAQVIALEALDQAQWLKDTGLTAKPITGLTEERILHLWDTHVGEPCEGLPLTDDDKKYFAQAITRALAEKNGLAVQGGE